MDFTTDYGRNMNMNLMRTNSDSLSDGLEAAANSYDHAEQVLGDAFVEGAGKDSKVLESLGLDKSKTYSDQYVQTRAQNYYQRIQTSFMTLQQLKTKAHDMMMEIIKTIGR